MFWEKCVAFSSVFGVGLLLMFPAGAADVSHAGSFASGPGLKRITTGPAPDYHVKRSPDGKTLAFASQRSGNTDVWVMPAGGGQAIQLTRERGTDCYPVWSPDGSMIALTSDRSGNLDI